MAQASATATPKSASGSDERVRRISGVRKLLNRPELGSLSGVILVFMFFALVAPDSGMFSPDGTLNWLQVSAELGIIAIGATMLMIAGEFDLSIGSMIGFSGMMIGIANVFWGWPVWAAIIFAFALALAIGFINGYIVVKTGLPSFIVTLAFLFILRGLTIGLSVTLTNRTIISGVIDNPEDDWLANLFGGDAFGWLFQWLADIGVIDTFVGGVPVVQGIPMSIIWWLGLAAVASWVLMRTKYGNWIFASGGDAKAAKNVGVPTDWVKISLFMFTAFCATVYAACQVTEFGSASADRGVLKELEAIVAAVIGGTLLTGGYGTVVGACFGALIFGVVQMGLYFTGVESSWFRVFVGAMLLVAVIFNNYIRKRVTEAR
ncbi:ABC transporter permease [Arhodomonas sp. AD133]|uniref:ABC transporter permease n=1 Tax=Arhodomonas sp. AD133 TaxID=3415009 RepID=UPI003EBB8D50